MLEIAQTDSPKLRLRWRFEYLDKPAKYGAWDYTGNDPELSAWRQPREGLLMAILEAKTIHGTILRMVECPGPDYCNFQWEIEAKLRANSMNYRQIGLTLISRTHRYTIYMNGQSEITERQSDDFDNHYEYGKV